ncbi:hypothetical protein ACOSQ2_026369 [Xanthoceras sorbifolium]
MNPNEGSVKAQPTRGSPLTKPPLHNLSLNHHNSPKLLGNQDANLKQQKPEHYHRSDHTNNTTHTLSSMTSQRRPDLNPRRSRMGRNCWERSPRTLSCPSLFLPIGVEEGSREPRKIGQGAATTKEE